MFKSANITKNMRFGSWEERLIPKLFEPAEREHGARPFGENEHANKAQLKVIWIRKPIPNPFLTIMILCLKYGAKNQLGGKIIINIDTNNLQNEVPEPPK